MKKICFLLLLSALMLCGCKQYKNVKVESVQLTSFQLLSTSKASIGFDLMVNNPSHSSLSLSVFEGVLLKNYTPFASFSLGNSPTIGPSTREMVRVNLDMEIIDPISLLSTGLNIKSWKSEDFLINTRLTVKSSSGIRKTFKFKEQPMDKIINSFTK